MDIEELMTGQGFINGEEPNLVTEVVTEDAIDTYQEPTTDSWWLAPLYNDKLMWQIGFDGRELVIRHGQIGGVIQEARRKVAVNSSGRSLQEQALLEARQRYWKQEHKGYANGNTILPQYPKPMLANKYEPKKIKAFPILVQPKIDGVRSLAHLTPQGSVHLRSRENKEQLHLDQIRDDLSHLFSYLPSGCHLDGELYVHGWSFNTLISAVRTGQISKTTKSQKDKHPLNGEVCYYVFDAILPLSASQRQDILAKAFEECLKDHSLSFTCLVPTTLCHSHDELLSFHHYYVDNGYEGAIVRHSTGCNRNGVDLTAYRDKRSDNLLKVKMFQDEEGTVVDVVEGAGTEEGLAILVVEDDRGNRFQVRPRGTFDMRERWFAQRARLIGQRYTYRYFELTEYGVPRFPVGVAFRDYE